jgi:serine protease Do
MKLPLVVHQLIGCCFIIAVTILPAQILRALPASEVSKMAQSVTVLIDSDNGFGSGVIIAYDKNLYTVLTAAHVVQDALKPYKVTTPDGKVYSVTAKAIRKLNGIDLAVIQFESSQSYKLAQIIDSRTASLGTVVYTAGFPAPGQAIQDRFFQFTSGEISGQPVKAQKDGYALIYTNITRRGMSGGPVLNANGQLIGIHGRAETDLVGSESLQVKAGINLGIPINTFIESLPKLGIKLPQDSKATPFVTTVEPSAALSIVPNKDASSATTVYTPSSIPSRPKVIRLKSSGSSSPICAGSTC